MYTSELMRIEGKNRLETLHCQGTHYRSTTEIQAAPIKRSGIKEAFGRFLIKWGNSLCSNAGDRSKPVLPI